MDLLTLIRRTQLSRRSLIYRTKATKFKCLAKIVCQDSQFWWILQLGNEKFQNGIRALIQRKIWGLKTMKASVVGLECANNRFRRQLNYYHYYYYYYYYYYYHHYILSNF